MAWCPFRGRQAFVSRVRVRLRVLGASAELMMPLWLCSGRWQLRIEERTPVYQHIPGREVVGLPERLLGRCMRCTFLRPSPCSVSLGVCASSLCHGTPAEVCLRQGAVEVLLKPMKVEHVLRVVNRWCRPRLHGTRPAARPREESLRPGSGGDGLARRPPDVLEPPVRRGDVTPVRAPVRVSGGRRQAG